MELKELEGKHILQGIEVSSEPTTGWSWCNNANYIKFKLDGVTYKATENPDDGYRSYCKELEIVKDNPEIPLPDVEVECRHKRYNKDKWGWSRIDDILEFTDVKNGKVILTIGTEDIGDYYPGCVLSWVPENLSINENK